MRREEREQILKQGVVSAETPRGRRERETLAEDIRSSRLHGPAAAAPPAQLPARRPTAYLSALGGPLPYMVRLREITEMTASTNTGCGRRERRSPRRASTTTRSRRHGRPTSGRWSFDEVNEPDRPPQPVLSRPSPGCRWTRARGTYALVGGEDYRRSPLDAAWALERFPRAVCVNASTQRLTARGAPSRAQATHDRGQRRARRAQSRGGTARHRRVASASAAAERRARPAPRPPRRCS